VSRRTWATARSRCRTGRGTTRGAEGTTTRSPTGTDRYRQTTRREPARSPCRTCGDHRQVYKVIWHRVASQPHTHTADVFSKLRSRGGSGPPSATRFAGPTRVRLRNGISIGSAVLHRSLVYPTHRAHTCDMCRKRPHLCTACKQCGPKTPLNNTYNSKKTVQWPFRLSRMTRGSGTRKKYSLAHSLSIFVGIYAFKISC